MKKKAILPLTHRTTFGGVFAFQADCAFTIIWLPNSRSKLIFFNSLFNINVCTVQLAKESKSCLLTTSSCFFVWHLGSGHRSRDSKKDQLLFLRLCDPESSLSYTSVGWGLPLLPTALTSFSLPMYWYTTAACYWLSLIIWFVLVTLCCPLFSSLLVPFTQMAPSPWHSSAESFFLLKCRSLFPPLPVVLIGKMTDCWGYLVLSNVTGFLHLEGLVSIVKD